MIDATVHVNGALHAPLARPLDTRIEAAVRAALATGVVGRPPLLRAELSITLVGGAKMRELNRRFHGVDAPTDVLAFDLGSPGEDDPSALLGDVYVCVPVANAAAVDHDEDLETEITRLAIHGTLHLLGHEHPSGEDRDRSEMFRLQERLISSL